MYARTIMEDTLYAVGVQLKFKILGNFFPKLTFFTYNNVINSIILIMFHDQY